MRPACAIVDLVARKTTPAERVLSGHVGNLSRWGRLEEAATARTALAVERVATDLVDLNERHTLTAAQRARLAAVLSCSPEEAPADARANGGRPGIPTGPTAAN